MDSLQRLIGRDPRIRLRIDSHRGVLTHARGALGRVRTSTPRGLRFAGLRFLETHAELFGGVSARSLRPIHEELEPNGGCSVTFQQHHGSSRVEGGVLRFHCDRHLNLDCVTNHLSPDLARLPRQPRISGESADRALRAAARVAAIDTPPQQRMSLTERELVVTRHEGAAHLAWKIRVTAEPPGDTRPETQETIGYVDALTGHVLALFRCAKPAESGRRGCGAATHTG